MLEKIIRNIESLIYKPDKLLENEFLTAADGEEIYLGDIWLGEEPFRIHVKDKQHKFVLINSDELKDLYLDDLRLVIENKDKIIRNISNQSILIKKRRYDDEKAKEACWKLYKSN